MVGVSEHDTQPNDLNDFLSQIESVGTIDSCGSFTLSPESASELMRRFRLPDPHMYLLQIVAFAVSGSADSLHIETFARTVRYVVGGLGIGEEQLRVLDTFLFPTVDAPVHLVELAVGIEAALNFAEEVRVESFSAEGSWRLIINLQGAQLETLRPVSLESPVSRVNIKKRLEVNFLWNTHRHPELAWLETCRHCALDIAVDGAPLQTSPLPALPAGTILWAEINLAGVEAPALGLGPAPAPALREEHGSAFGFLTLLPREEAYKQGLLFVHRGLIVHRPLSDLGLPVISGVIHCDTLKKNLSHTNFVEDAHFEELRDFLQRIGLALVTEFCRQMHLHREQWKHLWSAVVALLEDGRLSAEQEGAVREWADYVHQTGEDQGPFSDLQKARFLAREGRHEEAAALRRALLGKLRGEALLFFDNGLLSGLLDRCEVLRGLMEDLESPLQHELRLAERMAQCLVGLPHEFEQEPQDAEPVALHRIALIHRWHGDLATAVEYHLRALQHPEADVVVRGWGIRYCAELEFSQGRYEQAEELYSMAAMEQPKHRDLWEERAYFKRFLGPEFKSEAFDYLRKALEGVEADSFVHRLLLEEVKREGRSLLTRSELAALNTRTTYLKLRGKQAAVQPRIEKTLAEPLDLQGWTSRRDFIDRKLAAVLQAESAFGPTYLYTRFCRRRCAYQLHRLGAAKEAEHLQCRGHLLEHLWVILNSLASQSASV